MKICNFSAQGYTGIAYYDHSFCKALHQKGVEVTFITSDEWLVDKKMAVYPIKFFFVDTYGQRSRIKKGLAYLRGIHRTFWFVVLNNIQIIHFQLLELPVIDLLLFIAFRLAGKKIVFTPHDIVSFKFGENQKILSLLFKFSHAVIAHNQSNVKMLTEKFPESAHKIHTIQQGNYNDYLHPEMSKQQAREQINLPQDKTIILLFGNIRAGKGTETGVAAYDRIKDKHGTILVIAGRPNRGYDMHPIMERVNKVSMRDHVILRDTFIKDEDVEAYYKAADIVLVPYDRIYTSAVLVYAFSCQCATIVSDQRELLEFVQDQSDCLVFKTKDAADLADKIEILRRDRALAARIAERAKYVADHDWTWEKTAKTLTSIYSTLIEGES